MINDRTGLKSDTEILLENVKNVIEYDLTQALKYADEKSAEEAAKVKKELLAVCEELLK